jgi:outer membrane lipoprotein carrier protein
MTKKHFSLIIIAVVLVFSGFVQEDLEKKAKEILKSVTKVYKSHKSIYSEFQIFSENKAEKTKAVKENGKIWLKGNKYKLEFEDQIIYCNGKTVWTYFKQSKELTIENYVENNSEISPTNIFSFFQNGFNAKYDGKYEKSKGSTIDKISLNPVDKKKPYYFVTMHIENKSKAIKKLEISFKNGVKQTLDILKESQDEISSNTFFDFETGKHSVTSTDDLR